MTFNIESHQEMLDHDEKQRTEAESYTAHRKRLELIEETDAMMLKIFGKTILPIKQERVSWFK